MDLLSYDLRDENSKTQEGVALFANSQVLVSKYPDGIAHINVTPQAVQKVLQEAVEAHVLRVIMIQ